MVAEAANLFPPLSSLCLAEAFSSSSSAFGKGEEKRKRIPEVLNLEVETIETAAASKRHCHKMTKVANLEKGVQRRPAPILQKVGLHYGSIIY